jgi:hypothetical protein
MKHYSNFQPIFLALLFLVVQIFLVWPVFFPSIDDIGPWDEAAYLHSGQMLLDQGAWPIFANNPLPTALYALTYLPFRSSLIWLQQSDALGRVLAFGLLFTCVYLVARQFHTATASKNSGEAQNSISLPAIMLGLFLVMPLSTSMFAYPSDPLFAGLAGLSFWQVLSYYNTGRLRHAGYASLLLGLAALARNDGLVLFPILVVALALISLHWNRQRNVRQPQDILRSLAVSSLPFILLIGGYILFYGFHTGVYDLGTMGRTYDNFEAGQGIIFTPPGEINPTSESQLAARQAFGTSAENNYSIFNAIRRNPGVYLQRVVALAKTLPSALLNAYGIRFAAVLFLLVLRGAWVLLRRKAYLLLLLLIMWPLHLVSAFAITLVRVGHLQFPFYIVLALAALGISAALEDLAHNRRAAAWFLVLVGLSIASLVANKLAVFYGAAAFLLALVVIWFANRWSVYRLSSSGWGISATLLVLLAAGLVLHGDYPSPTHLRPDESPKIAALTYLVENLPPNSPVAAAVPGPIWMAKMTYMGLSSTDVPRNKTPAEFLEWLRIQDIRAVYVDPSLYNSNPAVWRLIEPQIGIGLERAFQVDQGNIQILLVH